VEYVIGAWRRTQTPSTRHTLLLTTIVGLAILVGLPSQAGGAINGIQVTAQSPFVAPNGSFVLEIAIEGSAVEIGKLELAVTVFDRIQEESEIGAPPSRAASRLEPVALGDLIPARPGHYRLEIPVRAGDPIDDVPRLPLPEPGVYPLTVELRGDDGVLAVTRTNLIRLALNANEDPDPLQVATVLPVVPAEGITVADAQQLLATHPDLPLTVVLGDGVVSQLKDDLDLSAAFARALGDRPLVAAPNVDLDPSALAAIGRAELYHQAIVDTATELEALGLAPVANIAVVSEHLTADGARALSDQGIQLVIDASTSPAPNGFISIDGERLHLLRYDDSASRVFGELRSGVSRANEALARLTVRGQSNRSPIVIGGSGLGSRPTEALNIFFHALTRAGAPQPILLPEAATSSFQRRPAEHPRQDLELVEDLIGDIEALLGSYEAMFSGGGIGPQDYRLQLQSALSLNRNPQDRHRSLILLADDLGRELEVISLPDAQPVTMAARQGSIPLIVESRAAGPRLIMLRFRSDKVQVMQDSQLLVIEPGSSSIDVEVEARSLGASQLEVSVWTPDGERILASSQFQLRSTAVPGLGVLISVGALAFLIIWWYADHRRSRAKRIEARAADIIGATSGDRESTAIGPAPEVVPQGALYRTVRSGDPDESQSRQLTPNRSR